MLDRFRYLNYGLAAILAFVGAKMLLSDVWHMPTWLSLAVIVGCLAAAVGASVLRPAEHGEAEAA
jgi:tellurite resistance protein TerC